MDHHHYPNLHLVLAKHPSETIERMLVRLLVFCMHAHQNDDELMSFTKGLSSVDEPDIWHKGLDDQINMWIDIGEPSFERMKKACRLAKQTYVYSFNSKSEVWWKQNQAQFSDLSVKVFSFAWQPIHDLAKQIERTPSWSINISDGTLFITTPSAQIESNWSMFQ